MQGLPTANFFYSEFQMSYRVSTLLLQIFCSARRAANHKQWLQLLNFHFNFRTRRSNTEIEAHSDVVDPPCVN